MDSMSAEIAADRPPSPTFLPALRHLTVVVIVLEIAWLLPYAVPGLEDYRYLENLDIEPLQRAIRFEAPRAPADAPGAMPGGEPPPDDNALAALDPALAGDLAAERGLEAVAADEAMPAGSPGAESEPGTASGTLDPVANPSAAGLAASPTEGSAAAAVSAKPAAAEPGVAASANAAGVTDGLRGAAAPPERSRRGGAATGGLAQDQ